MSVTQKAYTALADAYDYFNFNLFAGSLPECLITLQRHKSFLGYYSPACFVNGLKEKTDEIALNPACMGSRTVEQTLSTLVHEMAHVWQEHFGKPPRKAYHNKEWADKMEAIGLCPSDTGAAGGKRTGQKMSHYIDEDGLFSHHCEIFLAQRPDFVLWYSNEAGKEANKKKDTSKTKYVCPDCDANAWAKPLTRLVCGECEEEMLPLY